MKRLGPWVVFLVLLVMALAMLELISFTLQPGHLVQAMLMAAAPAPFYIALVLWFDRFEPEPPAVLASAFVLGACLATFVSLNLNEMSAEAYMQSTKDAGVADVMTSIINAPIVEECCKAFCLMVIYWFHRREVDGTLDAIIYSVMVALGFAVFENIIYYGSALDHDRATFVFCLRGVISAFSHPLFTSMTGLGLGWALENARHDQRSWWAVVGGLLLAICLHVAWNFSVVLNFYLWVVLYLLVMIPAGIGVITVIVSALGREASWVRQYLKGELSQTRLEMACSVKGRIRFSLQQLWRQGPSGWWHSERFLVLASRLAFLKRRRDQGETVAPELEMQLREAMRAEEAWLSRQFARPE